MPQRTQQCFKDRRQRLRMFSKHSLHALSMHRKLTDRPSSEYIHLAILRGLPGDQRCPFAVAASHQTWNSRKRVIKTPSGHPVHHELLYMLSRARMVNARLSSQPLVPLQDA